MASMNMEGLACDWFRWWNIQTTNIFVSWDTFKRDFFKRFQDMEEKDNFAKLIRLQQKGMLEEYTRNTHNPSSRVPELSLNHLIQIYVAGLSRIKPRLRCIV